MSSRFPLGALCAVVTITIWAGWLVVMRIGMASHLAVVDLIALRFAVAGIVMVPVVTRRGWALDRLGWTGFAAIVIGGGAAYTLTVGGGPRLRAGGVWESVHAGRAAAHHRGHGGDRAQGEAHRAAQDRHRADHCRRRHDRGPGPGRFRRTREHRAGDLLCRRPCCGRPIPSPCARRGSTACTPRRSPAWPR